VGCACWQCDVELFELSVLDVLYCSTCVVA